MTRALRERVMRLPKSPGVYQWKDDQGAVLYVGKARELRSRTLSYLSGDIGEKNAQMIERAADIDYIAVSNNKEALILEQTLIKRLKPRYNVRLTDDKSYPYIKLTKPPWPRLMKVHGIQDDGATYFGPFPDGYGAYHVMQALQDLFPLRRCKTVPDHKCLYYDIGKCVAPCIDACTDEEYDAIVKEVEALLRGKASGVLRRLKSRIEQAAMEKRYEEAGRLRDQLQGLQGVLERQHMLIDRLEDRDIAAMAVRGDRAVVAMVHQRDGKVVGQSPFNLQGAHDDKDAALADFLRGHYANRVIPRYVTLEADAEVAQELENDLRDLSGRAITVETPQRGDKRRWLDVAKQNADLRLEEESLRHAKRRGAVESLQRALGLPEPPAIIEGFDISHQAGAHTRAAMVRFVDGEPDKAGYRTFNMRDLADGEVDDYLSMAEAVRRRYTRLRDDGSILPDLILIDGGKGQLRAAKAALDEAGVVIPVCSLAKQDEEVFLPNKAHPVRLPRDHPGLQLLQRVRDEAHRFGITQVRRKATRGVTHSPIDPIPGIGPKKRKQLVDAFGGMEGLRTASEEDLIKVPGITDDLAKQLVAVLRTDEAPPNQS